MDSKLYRFRSIKNLLGKHELEKQQIYFAALDQLNDPIEGTRQYFWQGDKIVWGNFLKHYLLCLEHVITLATISPDNKKITKKDIPIFKSEMNLPTALYRERIQKIYKHFFSNSFVKSYLQLITKNPNKIYLDEMYVHLKVLSGTALESIFEINTQSGLIPNPENSQPRGENSQLDLGLTNVWDELYDDPVVYRGLIDSLYDTLKTWDSQLILQHKDSLKLQSINIEFPQMYLNAVVELTYPKAYVACFMDNCLNSSIWATYGDNHTGICLKFNTNNGPNPVLPLKTTIGYCSSSGKIYEYRDFSLQPIEYSSSFDELDFFRNLGRLQTHQLIEQWYTDENGELSICYDYIFSHKDEWREQHWNLFKGSYLKKLPAWSHEREYRIVLSSVLNSYDDPKDRLLEYKFENLEAIIFGMRTPLEAKAEIIEIVKRKCTELGRDQFDFFEIAYSNSKEELYLRKLFSLTSNGHQEISTAEE